MFGKMKIRGKILTGYLVILTFTVVIALAAVGWLFDKTNELANLYDGPTKAMEYASEMKVQITEMQLEYEKIASGTLSKNQTNEAVSELEKLTAGFSETYKKYEKTMSDDTDDANSLYEEIGRIFNDNLIIVDTEIYAAIDAGDATQINTLKADLFDNMDQMKANTDQLIALNSERLETSFGDTIDIFKFSLYMIILAIAVAITVDIITAFKISGSISRPLKKLVTAANKIALGDVNVNADIPGNDETAELGKAFQHVIDSFREQAKVLEAIANGDYSVKMNVTSDEDIVGKTIEKILDNNTQLIKQIQVAADGVSIGSKEISYGAQSLATGSNEQAATVEALSSRVGEVREQAEETMHHAIEADSGMEKIGKLTQDSSESMSDLIAAMELINQSSNEIAKVIRVIDDIAFQTNILALNAAVEAARAGQHGKGFAVVADEVRILASKSAEAAKETASLISSSYEKVQSGSLLAEKAGSSMFEISDIVKDNLRKVTIMRDAAEKQTDAIIEINHSVSQITKIVNENSSTAEESAASSEELNAQSEVLKESIRKIKIES